MTGKRAGNAGGSKGGPSDRRIPLLGALGVVLVVVVVLAFRQSPRPDPFQPVELDSIAGLWDWFRHPIERNAWERLPRVSADLRALHVDASGDHVWIVGDRGTVLHSSDAGDNWSVQTIPREAWVQDAPAYDQPPEQVGKEQSNEIDSPEQQQKGYIPPRSSAAFQQAPPSASLSEPRPPDLLGVFVKLDRRTGWIVGEQGTLLETADGGETWKTIESGWDTSVLERIEASRNSEDRKLDDEISTGTGLAVEEGGSVVDWSDGIVMSSEGTGWQVGREGRIFRTSDGAATWMPQSLSGRDVLRSVALTGDGLRGWAVGAGGRILSTSDGGASWRPFGNELSGDLRCVDIAKDGSRTWVVGGEDDALMSIERRSLRRLAADQAFVSVAMSADAKRGWAIGRDRTLLSTSDGGESWEPTDLEDTEMVVAAWEDVVISAESVELRFHELRSAFQRKPGSDALIPFTLAIAMSWETDSARGTVSPSRDSDGRLHAIVPGTNGERGMAVGDSGTILTTSDTGSTWTPSTSGTSQTLRAAAMSLDGTRACVAGDCGVLLRTEDGGRTWSPPRYRRIPAPWSWAATLLLGFAGFVVVRRPREREETKKPSIADLLASDRPLERGDRDVLDFATLSSGVVRFLANEKTVPPLTIAVTGEWGTGKSSLMNLIRAGVRDYGFRTIWFNAWHHQTEEHLLGALNEALDREATPAWWTLEGLTFRARLLFRRGLRRWVPVALFLVVLGATARLLVANDQARLASAVEGLHKALRLQAPEGLGQGGNVLALLFMLFSPIVLLRRGLSTFRASTSSLSSWLLGSLRIGEMGQRQRFAERFRDVTEALGARRLVLFIDDLDRCQPTVVVRVLELVNFLVSSGPCYVVLGIAPRWVASAVGLGFKEVADEAAEMEEQEKKEKKEEDEARLGAERNADLREEGHDPRGASGSEPELAIDRSGAEPPPPDLPAAKRRRFALKYLSKLVNIEIPVPEISPVQAARLLDAGTDLEELAREPGQKTKRARLLREVRAVFSPVAPLAFFTALVVVAFVLVPLALERISPVHSAPQEPVPVATGEPTLDLPGAAPVIVPPSEPREPSERDAREEPTSVAPFEPGQRHELPSWPIHLLVALGLAWGVFELSRSRLPLEKDTKDFRAALELWAPVVYRANPSPRSVKRFLNRVRYMAMCQRPAARPPTRWQRLRAQWKRSEESTARGDGIPAPLLVALGAVDHAYPRELDGDRPWQHMGSWIAERSDLFPAEFRERAARELGVLTGHREAFLALRKGITIRV